MKKLHKSACREIIHHSWSGQRERPHKAEVTSAEPSWMIRHLATWDKGWVCWLLFMAGCLPINSQVKMSPSDWRNSHQTQPATLTGHYSLIKVRLNCSSPWFEAYITKALQKQSPSWLYILSQWLHTLWRTRLQRETGSFTACCTDSSLPCYGI